MTREQRLLEAYQQAAEVHRIAARAVRKAQEESRRLGVANVYSRDGRLYYDPPRPSEQEGAAGATAPRRAPQPAIAGKGRTESGLIDPAVDANDGD